MTWHQNLFIYGLYASYILYAVILFGLSNKAPEYLSTLDNVLKIYICLFLLIRFNPFTDIKFNEFDRARGILFCFILTDDNYSNRNS